MHAGRWVGGWERHGGVFLLPECLPVAGAAGAPRLPALWSACAPTRLRLHRATPPGARCASRACCGWWHARRGRRRCSGTWRRRAARSWAPFQVGGLRGAACRMRNGLPEGREGDGNQFAGQRLPAEDAACREAQVLPCLAFPHNRCSRRDGVVQPGVPAPGEAAHAAGDCRRGRWVDAGRGAWMGLLR